MEQSFLCEVIKVFYIPQQGVAIKAKIVQGKIEVGKELDLTVPGDTDYQVVCRGLAKDKVFVNSAQTGETIDVLVGINWVLPLNKLGVRPQGCFLSEPHTVKVSKSFEAKCQTSVIEYFGEKKRLQIKLFNCRWLCEVSHFKEIDDQNFVCKIELIYAMNIANEQPFELYEEDQLICTGKITKVIY